MVTSVMYDAYFNWHVSPFKSWSTSGALVIGEPLVDRSPHSFQMAACDCVMWKVYLESEYIFALLLVMRVRALVSAISSAFWEEVPEGSLEKEMTIHSSILFFFFPLQYSYLENPVDRGACWDTVHGVAKS